MYKPFIPYKIGSSEYKTINLKNDNYYAKIFNNGVPTVAFENKNATVKDFFNALINSEEPKVYISKNTMNIFDFDELYDFKNNISYSVRFNQNVQTISLMNTEKTKLIHIKLVNEPDAYSKWKIIDIVKERCQFGF